MSHLPVSCWPILETWKRTMLWLAVGSCYLTCAQPHLSTQSIDTVSLQPGNHSGAVSSFIITVSAFIKMALPRVFFDITIGGAPAGRIVMEVRETDYLLNMCRFNPAMLSLSGFKWVFCINLCVSYLCVSQLRADVVPKTAGMWSLHEEKKLCSGNFPTTHSKMNFCLVEETMRLH